MSLLTITAEYSDPAKPPKAETIVKLTTHFLKLIRAIEKENARVGGYKYRPIDWQLRVFQFHDRAIVELDAPRSKAEEDPTARAAAEKAVQAKVPDFEGIK